MEIFIRCERFSIRVTKLQANPLTIFRRVPLAGIAKKINKIWNRWLVFEMKDSQSVNIHRRWCYRIFIESVLSKRRKQMRNLTRSLIIPWWWRRLYSTFNLLKKPQAPTERLNVIDHMRILPLNTFARNRSLPKLHIHLCAESWKSFFMFRH